MPDDGELNCDRDGNWTPPAPIATPSPTDRELIEREALADALERLPRTVRIDEHRSAFVLDNSLRRRLISALSHPSAVPDDAVVEALASLENALRGQDWTECLMYVHDAVVTLTALSHPSPSEIDP